MSLSEKTASISYRLTEPLFFAPQPERATAAKSSTPAKTKTCSAAATRKNGLFLWTLFFLPFFRRIKCAAVICSKPLSSLGQTCRPQTRLNLRLDFLFDSPPESVIFAFFRPINRIGFSPEKSLSHFMQRKRKEYDFSGIPSLTLPTEKASFSSLCARRSGAVREGTATLTPVANYQKIRSFRRDQRFCGEEIAEGC